MKRGHCIAGVKSPAILAALCLAVVCSISVAGLWPFHAPRNQVRWLTGGNGLHFGYRGIALSRANSRTTDSPDSRASLDVWLEPGDPAQVNTFLTFYLPGNSRQFSLLQNKANLILERRIWDSSHRWAITRGGVAGVFRDKRPVLLTLTSNGNGSAIFVDGRLTAVLAEFPLSYADFSNQLILGNSEVGHHSWIGDLKGIGIYAEQLPPLEAAAHYTSWKSGQARALAANERTRSLYLFDERGGNAIHNMAKAGASLYIPERYSIVHPTILQLPWKEYRASLSYWKDVAINIGGFIPLGTCFYAYLRCATQVQRAALLAMVLGTGLSLTIELLQTYLPTRVSSMTDVMTNTLGTGIGVVICRMEAWWSLLLGHAFSEELAELIRR